MRNRRILVDSSAWINHFLGKKRGAWDAISGLLEEDRVATNDVIRMEILTGAKDEVQYNKLSDEWEGLYQLPMTTAIWRRAERLRFDLRRKGKQIPLADTLIAASATAYGCELLCADRHFEQIAALMPLDLFQGNTK